MRVTLKSPLGRNLHFEFVAHEREMDARALYLGEVVAELAGFTDPFSGAQVPTERLCYPVTYLSPELRSSIQNSAKDRENDQMYEQSLRKDAPKYENLVSEAALIVDGAAHLFANKVREPLVVVVGMPRVGKSGLMRKLALIAALAAEQDREAAVPVLCGAHEVGLGQCKGKAEIFSALRARWTRHAEFLASEDARNGLIWLIDDFEEVGA